MVLLILDRTQKNRILQVHHFRNAATFGAEEPALSDGRAVDQIIRGTQKLAQEFRFRDQIGSLGMGGEHAVLDIHARVQG